MAKYYLNKNAQDNGDHEVHIESCKWLPEPHNRLELGEFSDCAQAVKKGKEQYPTADGCAKCIPSCHKS